MANPAVAGASGPTRAVNASGRRPDGSRARPRSGTGVDKGGVPVDRRSFEPGACVAFGPTRGNVHRTVFIDAGHGSIDPGGAGVTRTGRTIYEAPTNLAIALATMRLLTAEGFRVVLSRTIATEVVRLTASDLTTGVLSAQGARADIAARDQCANEARATLLVGIYLDAGTTPLDAGSLTAYDASRPFAAKSKAFASLLQNDVLAHLNAHGWQIPNDGVQTDATLGGQPLTTTAAAYPHLLLLGPGVTGWFTTPSKMPGALIEPLYVSDPFEGSIAVSSAGRTAVALGMAQAVGQYFHVRGRGGSSGARGPRARGRPTDRRSRSNPSGRN